MVESSIGDSEWLTIPEGTTECSDAGIMCQNLAEIELKTNALIVAKELQNQMKG